MNRFWICLPRNSRGINQLKNYKKISRFEIVREKNRANSYINWKMNGNPKKVFRVYSPLAKYLEEQRSKMDISGNWCYELERIVAKDYAVLARFRDTSGKVTMNENLLNDYFLFGIRGLGTWGAAWFVDRKYTKFDKIDEREDFQYLLEVEYRDGRIFNVQRCI